MVTPYYDRGIVIYHGDCLDVMPTFADGSAGLGLTDPPYSPAFHDGARTGDESRKLVSFDHIEIGTLRRSMAEMFRVSRRWVVSFIDWRHATALESDPPAGGRFVRLGVWAKRNGAPQFTGDRPAPGWEAIAFMHKADLRLSWNGGGRSSVFSSNISASHSHPTEKPLSLLRQLVVLFSDPGDIVIDPYAGSGTTLRAAKDEGRRAIGIEIDERYCEIAARKLAQEVLFP